RIDNEVLFRLAAVLAGDADVRERLDWSPNTSLVNVAGRWRYAEARAGEGNAVRYHLVAVDPTPYFNSTIARARGGAKLAGLAELDATGGDATAYERVAEDIEAMFVAAGSPTTIERARLFQVDVAIRAQARLGRDVVAHIERVVEWLRTMTPAREHPGLAAM